MYDCSSGAEHGTLYQLRNLTDRRNVVKKPKADFNACDDFFQLVVICHVLAAAMEVLRMNSITDTPDEALIPADTWMQTKEDRKSILHATCKSIVDQFATFPVPGDSHSKVNNNPDTVNGYACEVLNLGLFYLEYADAVKEGDGNRVLRCWHYLLPLFKASGRVNYSLEVLYTLYQLHFSLSPRQVHQLLWSRFVNVHGLPSHNIESDLHMEHLNRMCKDAISYMGANKTDKTIQRVGKSIGTITRVTDKFDNEHSIRSVAGKHAAAKATKDQHIILSELTKLAVFQKVSGRVHKSFKSFKCSLFNTLDYTAMKEWMKIHLVD